MKIYRHKILPVSYQVDEEIMEIHIQLFSILREKLPPEAKGRTIIEVDEGTTVEDLLKYFEINRRVAISINDQVERDQTRPLEDGDHVKIFTSVGGG